MQELGGRKMRQVQRSHDTSGISEVTLRKICWVNSVHCDKSSLDYIKIDHWCVFASRIRGLPFWPVANLHFGDRIRED